MPADDPRYVVRRLNWQEPADGCFVRLPGEHKVGTFATPAAAEAYQRRREAAARTVVNPFACGSSFSELTGYPVPVFCDWLADAGLDPPPADRPLCVWERWWLCNRPMMSEGQAAHAWDGLSKLRFYDTTELAASDDVFVVLGVNCGNGDDYDYRNLARYAGGRPLTAHCHRAAAERSVREDHAIPFLDPYSTFAEAGARLDAGRDPFLRTRPRPADPLEVSPPVFAEVAPVAVTPDVLTRTGTAPVFLVHRLSWAWHADPAGLMWRATDSVDGFPVAACPTQAAAEAAAWERDAAAREYTNPFRFGHPVALTSIGEHGFKAILRDAGITHPADDWSMMPNTVRYPADAGDRGQQAWFEWWAATADELSVQQIDTVWDRLDQLRFHTAVEVNLYE